MINIQKFGRQNGNMVERAAARCTSAYLERQRTYKLYKRHMQEAKDSKELENDVVFEQLRNDMQTAKANHIVAQQTLEAVRVCPPL
jgi:hypothetical protein